jgi:hypothetical protein
MLTCLQLGFQSKAYSARQISFEISWFCHGGCFDVSFIQLRYSVGNISKLMMYFEKFAAGSVMPQVVIAVCKQNIASCMNAEEGRKYENFTN